MDDDTKLAILLLLMPIGVLVLVLAIIIGGEKFSGTTVLQIIAAFMTVISAVMIYGKGGWAVAGYNTMTPEEKSQYDEKKIARGCGFIMLGTAVMLIVIPYGWPYITLGITAFVISIIVGLVYSNVCAKV